MATEQEILALKDHYVNSLYSQVKKEQVIDQSYIDDTFDVPEVHEPHHIYRSGLGIRIVDSPAENVITDNPQVTITPVKATKVSQEAALNLSTYWNEHAIPILQKQNPNPFKEFVKAQLGRGEGFFKVVHNQDWVTGLKLKEGLPVHIIPIDPYVVYASPEETHDGIPHKVFIWYQQQFKDVVSRYPHITHNGSGDETIDWLEYYDMKTRFIRAGDNYITRNGVQENLYGLVPFVRKYSGFGRRSYDGQLANLIMSDIRRSRDLIREECAMRSNIASVMYLYAHRPITLMTSGAVADPEKLRDAYSLGEYDFNIIDNLPPDSKLIETKIEPTAEAFRHHQQIIAELNQRHPFILSGFPMGANARQQDLTQLSAMRRYDSIVSNTENAFATAIQIAHRIIKKIPGLLPPEIKEKDLQFDYEIKVRLKAKDVIEEDRKITLGDRLWNSGKGSISIHRFHTEYQGMTESESKKEIARMLADQITIYNPDVAAVMGMVAAEESGMEEWLAKARERRMLMEGQGGMRQEPPPSTTERIQGETQTQLGTEIGTQPNRGARNPPVAFTRG